MLKIGIHGGSGKMGTMIYECLKDYENLSLGAIFTIQPLKYTPNCVITANYDEFFDNCDVVIDFSIKQGAITLLKYAISHPKPLCIGTTALGEDGQNLLQEVACKMAVFYATNMSFGVAVLNKLAFLAAKILNEFDVEICEMHHKHKKDAPSGTALSLGNTIAKARNLNLNDALITSRASRFEARKDGEISIMSLRGGDIVGKHTVGFYTNGEFVEISHTATSRQTFANGAIKAAIWLSHKQNGLYGIEDLLGI